MLLLHQDSEHIALCVACVCIKSNPIRFKQ